eukprot:5020074-Amphidinium_carterae.2
MEDLGVMNVIRELQCIAAFSWCSYSAHHRTSASRDLSRQYDRNSAMHSSRRPRLAILFKEKEKRTHLTSCIVTRMTP